MALKVIYFALIRNQGLPNERTLGLFRRYYAADGIHMEQWDTRRGEWTHSPDLVSATGIGGDSDYEILTKERAAEMIRERNGTERDLEIG